MKSRGYEKLTISSVAVGLALLPHANAPGLALIRIEGGRVRYRDDGTDPTAAVGYPLDDGDVMLYDGPLAALKLIRRDASDATADIVYYGTMG